MRKVAYVFNQRLRRSHAGVTVAQGFGNAFRSMRWHFETFDLIELKLDILTGQKRRLIRFAPDFVFTSVENIHSLPLNDMGACSLILWGQFYKPCSFEKDTITISESIKRQLAKYRDKHRILVWSQHSDHINEEYFSGYRTELGLDFIQLMHCADRTQLIEPLRNPVHDFIWIGNVGHRRTVFDEIVEPLKKNSASFIEITERNPLSPALVAKKELYRNAQISINVHTTAQLKYGLVLNERVFASSLQGGFQVCDNPLAKQYFSDQELVIAHSPKDFLEALRYYKREPQARLDMIQRMQDKILASHLYEHRIRSIMQTLSEASLYSDTVHP